MILYFVALHMLYTSLKYVNHYGKCFSIPSLNDINHVHAVNYYGPSSLNYLCTLHVFYETIQPIFHAVTCVHVYG